LPQQLIDPAGRQAGALAHHVRPVLVIKAEQRPAEIDQQHLRAITVHCSTVAARKADPRPAQAARPQRTRIAADNRDSSPTIRTQEKVATTPAGSDGVAGNCKPRSVRRCSILIR
jgi:hypothetical protein